MPTYLDSGFDKFYERASSGSEGSQITALDQDALFDDVSGNKVRDGIIASTDGRTTFNLTNGLFRVNDGIQDRVLMGRMEDGTYGVRIVDQDGNTLIDVNELTNLLQSATGKMQIDFVEEQMRFYDEVNLRILIGKAIGKF